MTRLKAKELDEATEILQARFILPVSEPAMENAGIVLKENKILCLLDANELKELELLPNLKSKLRIFPEAVICPGLMNLHTHLDYSALKHFDNYSSFFDWIRKLIGKSWQWSQSEWLESALAGAKELLLSGASFAADASYSGCAAEALAQSGLRGLVGLELFGVIEEEAEQSFCQWLAKYKSFLDSASPQLKAAIESKRVQITVAPHTPYSVSPALIARALDWCKEKKLPLLIHIAESDAECQWIAAGNADLDKFLQEAFKKELPVLSWKGKGLSPVAHMAEHGLLDKSVLAAHLVKLSDSDIETLKANDVAAVHCPRSNSRLRNGIAQFKKMSEAGIRLALGTDSAASTDDLDILAESRFAWDLQRAVDPSFDLSAEQALYYLTLGAARALSMQDELGSLSPGKRADIAIFDLAHLPVQAREKPYECLIYGGARASALIVDGRWLMQDGKQLTVC